MRIPWNQIPLLRVIIPFILGLLVANWIAPYFQFSLVQAFYVLPIFFVMLIIIDSYLSAKSLKLNIFHGQLIQVFIFLLAVFYGQLNAREHAPPNINQDSQTQWYGEVSKVNLKKSGTGNLEISWEKINRDSSWEAVNGKAMIYFKHDPQLKVGDLIAASTYFNRFKPPLNPAAFDFRKFHANRHIYFYGFEDEFHVLGHRTGIVSLAAEVKKKVEQAYLQMGIEGDELSVLKALTLGDKGEIEAGLKADFAQAGAMHILAVSGLHVGIIFLILSQILSFLGKSVPQRWMKAIFLLTAIWSFALVSGWSPSVQRASWMFSFIILADALNRKANVLNSLAASALLLLLQNPNALFEVGFQLSYAAVVGIVLIYPKLYPFFKTPYPWLNKITGLLVVSIAAQLATMPLSLYYFHQFPNWFLFTNLFAIPLAFVIVSTGFFSVFLFMVFGNDFFTSELLNAFLQLLNYLVQLSAQLPASAAKAIWLTSPTVILIYLCIASLLIHLYFKKKSAFIFGLVCLLFAVGVEFYEDWMQLKQKQIGVYASSPEVISFINGLEAELFVNDSTLNERNQLLVEQHLNYLGVKRYHWNFADQAYQKNDLFEYRQKKGVKELMGFNRKIQLLERVDGEFQTNADALLLGEQLHIDRLNFQLAELNMRLIYSNKIPTWSYSHQALAKELSIHFLSRDGYLDLLELEDN